MAGVDKTGLDILCSGPGCKYFPPGPDGKSLCIFPDGTLMLCDSNTGKCMQVYVREVPEDDKAPSVAGVVTFRLLKLLKEHE
jgi:hypothetical protein